MHLPPVLAAPRLCFLAGRAFWVRPLSLAGWAVVLAWLDDVQPEGRDDRDGPPPLNSGESQAWLRAEDGRALLCWLGLRDDDVAYETAREMWKAAEPHEHSRFLSVLMARRRTAAPGREDEGSDLADTFCGEGIAELATTLGLDALGRLTLDQVEWLQSGGKCDEHADPDVKRRAEMQREWLAAREREQAEAAPEGTPADPPPVVRISADEGDRRRVAMLAALKEQVARRDAGLEFHIPTAEDVERAFGAQAQAEGTSPPKYRAMNLDTGEEVV